jgi:tRNA pseudouridine38-40 synthase
MKHFISHGRSLFLVILMRKDTLGWQNIFLDGRLNRRRCAIKSLLATEEYQETMAEQRMRLFWENHPFQIAESVVHQVLTLGGTSSFSRLLQPINHDDYDNDEIFSRFYAGKLVVAREPFPDFNKKFKRQSFRLDLAYAGQYFCGWQRQPNNADLPSVQAVVEDAITAAGYFCLNDGHRPDIRVSGRTDAGVHAVGQVARLRLRGNGSAASLTARDILKSLEAAAKLSSYTWRCLSVSAASDAFHPTFDSKSRSYVYLIDADPLSGLYRSVVYPDPATTPFNEDMADDGQLQRVVERLNCMLQALEGKELDFFAFSYGKVKTETTRCHIQHARARLLGETESSRRVLSIELTGDRFLRRMVRILVATVLQLEVTGVANENAITSQQAAQFDDQLVNICYAQDRQRTSKAAPPGGLIFVHATLH